jgi:hypothetical protein
MGVQGSRVVGRRCGETEKEAEMGDEEREMWVSTANRV